LSKFEKQLNAMRAIKYTKGGNSSKKGGVIGWGKVEKGGAAAAQVPHTRTHSLGGWLYTVN